jgi:hypothetical protein
MSLEPEFRRSSFCGIGTCVEVAFTKSSFSVTNGTCVEVAFERSSFCGNGACVEVARPEGAVLVRDGKDPGGPVLTFDAEGWNGFLCGVVAGEFSA